MATIKQSIVINADTQTIDQYAINAHTYPQWFAGVESVEVDSVFPEAGGKVKAQYKAAGITFELVMTTREIVHGSHIIFEMEGMITGTQQWSYAAAGGGTEVTCVFDYDMPGGALGAIADKLIVEKMNTDNIAASLASLKKVVEG